MLFGKRKAAFPVRVVTREADWIAAGCSVTTDDRSFAADLAAVQEKFLARAKKLRDVCSPWARVVVTYPKDRSGKFVLFTGQLVESAERNGEGFAVVRIAPGPAARITVDYRGALRWPVDVAKARSAFYEKWLPQSGWEHAGDYQDLEYYDQRSRIRLASMDLYFPLRPLAAEG